MFRKKNWQCLFSVIIFFFLWESGQAQENQSLIPKHLKDALMALYNTDNMHIDKLKDELMAAYRVQGETGVRNLIKEKNNEINLPLVIEITDSAFTNKNKEWLKISIILTEQKKNQIPTNSSESILYDTLYIYAKMGMCMCLDSQENVYKCLENLITEVEKINYPQAQEVSAIVKKSINALKMNLNKMEKVFDDEVILTKDKENPQHLGNMHLGKGAIYLNGGDYIRACEMLAKALALYEKAGDMKGQGNVYMLWGTLYRYVRDDQRAFTMLDKALPFFEKMGSLPEQFTGYRIKAEIYEDIGEYSKAVEMYNKALRCLGKTKNNQKKSLIYLALGHIYNETGNRIKARENYNKSLSLLGNEPDTIDKRTRYEIMGVVDFKNGDWAHAISMYEKAIPYYSEFGHFEGKGHLYKTLGVIHFIDGNYSKAAAMYDQAFQEYQKTGSNELLSHTLHRKAQALEKLGKKNEALTLFEEAIEK
ncbi:MAG TPA: tetratricopeptide repeat protein, partial [Candidatus Kapabacteria bacterium]|nr:tetratricopeptide repeat protein [Candidatus Kapabacteria bacterium]